MTADRHEIREAVEAATISKHHHSARSGTPAGPDLHEVNATRRTIVRFLENVPDDISAGDLRELMDGAFSDD